MSMRLAELAERLDCELRGDGELDIVGVAPIENAGPGELTFVANPRYTRHLATTRASAVILPVEAPAMRLPTLRTSDPYLAFARAVECFFRPLVPPPGIHATAVVAASARIGAGASIGPYCAIADGVTIGAGATLWPHVVVYAEVTIGDRFVAHAHVGHDFVLHAGVVIGSDGFGYVLGPSGDARKIPQSGDVVIEDGVEVGANTTIDRAAVGSTIVRRNAKLDNLVMIAHGCEIGEGSMLAAQAGLSGSTRLGRGVQMGGQAGSAGHLEVGDGARVAAQCGVTSSIAANATVSGLPAIDMTLWRRVSAALVRLPDLFRRVRRIEKSLGLRARDGRES
jgi:UDP-3-O-[3-hydroxymyristoyl] glucosamine N-acyltransferase